MPKAKITAPLSTPYTDERLGLPDNMIDEDNMEGSVEARFAAGASLQEGVSGVKPIDTLYENFSDATIQSPRNSTAPVQVNRSEYPHREY